MLKTKRIGLIVTEVEKSWVIELAKLEGGLSQASLIRKLIYEAATKKNLQSLAESQTILLEKNNEYSSAQS